MSYNPTDVNPADLPMGLTIPNLSGVDNQTSYKQAMGIYLSEITQIKQNQALYPSLRTGSANLAMLAVGASVDVTVTFTTPFGTAYPFGKSAADIVIAPALSGLTVSFIGKVSVVPKSANLTGCVVTIKNDALVALSGSVVNVIAVLPQN